MKIAEIFYSLQGEGTLVGVPSVFIRTSGCNLRCVWCDTPYTSWRPEGVDQSVDAIVEQAVKYKARHVVLTGGEPLIAPDIGSLAGALRGAGLHITVETAGTVYASLPCDLMSISPKLANSTPHGRDEGRWAAQHERLRYQPQVLTRMIGEYEHQLKFVVENPADLEEISRIRDEISARRENIILMPEGTHRDVLRARGLWLAEVCKQEGYRFSPRLHVDLWGDVRGV